MVLRSVLDLTGDGVVFIMDSHTLMDGVILTIAATGVAVTGTATGMATGMAIMPEPIHITITVMIGIPDTIEATDHQGEDPQTVIMQIMQEVQEPLVICMRKNIRPVELQENSKAIRVKELHEAFNPQADYRKLKEMSEAVKASDHPKTRM